MLGTNIVAQLVHGEKCILHNCITFRLFLILIQNISTLDRVVKFGADLIVLFVNGKVVTFPLKKGCKTKEGCFWCASPIILPSSREGDLMEVRVCKSVPQ